MAMPHQRQRNQRHRQQRQEQLVAEKRPPAARPATAVSDRDPGSTRYRYPPWETPCLPSGLPARPTDGLNHLPGIEEMHEPFGAGEHADVQLVAGLLAARGPRARCDRPGSRSRRASRRRAGCTNRPASRSTRWVRPRPAADAGCPAGRRGRSRARSGRAGAAGRRPPPAPAARASARRREAPPPRPRVDGEAVRRPRRNVQQRRVAACMAIRKGRLGRSEASEPAASRCARRSSTSVATPPRASDAATPAAASAGCSGDSAASDVENAADGDADGPAAPSEHDEIDGSPPARGRPHRAVVGVDHGREAVAAPDDLPARRAAAPRRSRTARAVTTAAERAGRSRRPEPVRQTR